MQELGIGTRNRGFGFRNQGAQELDLPDTTVAAGFSLCWVDTTYRFIHWKQHLTASSQHGLKTVATQGI